MKLPPRHIVDIYPFIILHNGRAQHSEAPAFLYKHIDQEILSLIACRKQELPLTFDKIHNTRQQKRNMESHFEIKKELNNKLSRCQQ